MRKHRKLSITRETLRHLAAVHGGLQNTSEPSISTTTSSLKLGCSNQCAPPPTAAETCGDTRPSGYHQV